MKESIGNTFIFYIVIIFVFIFIALFVGSTSYTKAFKVKNRIISILEKYGDSEVLSTSGGFTNNDVEAEIEKNLGNIGYRIRQNNQNHCKEYFKKHYKRTCGNNTNCIIGTETVGTYDYCIAQFKTSKGNYYAVLTYMYFDTPLLGTKVSIPIYGETKVMGLLN